MSSDDPPDLTAADYRRLREATRTYREEVTVRLAGEVGLRPAEMTRLRVADVDERVVDGEPHYLLTVDGSQGERRAYLPRDLHGDLLRYANEHDRGEFDPLFDVSARRLQMLVASVGDRLDGVDVSSRALRRAYARRLVDRGANPRVVRSMGGWSSLDTLADLYPEPDDEAIVRAVTGTDRTRTRTDRRRDDRFVGAVDALQAVGRAVDAARTRNDVEEAVCGTIVETGPYEAAWVLGTDAGERTPEVHARAGIDESAVATAHEQVEGLAPPAADGGERVAVAHVSLGERGRRHAVALVAVGHGDTTYGTLAVATAARGFAPAERDVLADLGRRVGQAIGAVTNRRLLQADAVVELSFRSGDDGACLVQMARDCGCSFALEGVVPASEGALVLYERVTGTAPETVVDRASEAEGIANGRLVRSGADGAVVELRVTGDTLAAALAEHGGHVAAYEVDETGATLTAEFPTDVDVRTIVNEVTGAFPETEFVARREVPHPISTPDDVRGFYDADLTDKQRAVLEAAYLAGYFDWPRGTTAEELADALGISSPTLHNHLRKAQRSVLDELFEDDT